ncbi:T9SS type A sorting domain-containing protein [Constantimarinum furrinae]|uniref:Secretion system C-terminal sorting domain-containing protein n=1 Tax=Constantimarinum furrinae TaxID=2562285 RepID=A0A7G8PR21_9FLAO|nr:T9SS type A sorting domain-containing protein [Constantimarinum furrinae]QNJ96787.1 hypothetical protein ALE3EI_0197 [Constantimarinum furrinae]
MKNKYFITLLIGAFTLTLNAQIEYEEDFEFFTLGDISMQSPHWRTWSGNNGGAEDADVVDSQSLSGDQSVLIDDSEIMDQILLTPSQPTSGVYSLKVNMYIPAGRGAYFNMQAANSAGAWNQALMGGNVYFNCDGASGGSGGVTGVIDCSTFDVTFAYPEDQWFEMICVYDIDAMEWAMYIDGTEQFSGYPFAFGTTVFVELAGFDFFSASPHNEYYMDDLVLAVGDLTLGVNSFTEGNFSVYPNPVKDILNISSVDAVSRVTVYDVLGKVVLQEQPDRVSPSIDMGALSNGAYLVQVTIGNSTKTVKVVK